jgi:hypothetical protein
MRGLLPGLIVLTVATAWADDPVRPPYKRLLNGDDAKAVTALRKQSASAEERDDYAEAIKAAEEVAAIRTRVQGADHWQVREASFRVSTLRQVAALPGEERKAVREANDLTLQAVNLNAQGRYAQAQLLCEKALAIRRKALG